MFERIKCYKRLKEAEKLILGSRRLGELLEDDEMIKEAEAALRLMAFIKEHMWFDRQMAKKFNREFDLKMKGS